MIMEKTAIIETKSGKIQGYMEDDIHVFKGVPFAAPPIEDLRFSPPIDAEPWDDVLETTEYSPWALQGFSPLELLLGKPPSQSEDCLKLNIWTPSTDDKKRPVMFWIHGGAFRSGSGALPLYQGSALARRGDVVVVTINYRIGCFGYLYIPGVIANVGQFDQIKALEWVRDNIEAFGGNPEDITIFGESAGGVAVMTLLAMPAAKGLFHRVISQSGPFFEPKPNVKSTYKLFRKLKLQKGDLDALRKVPGDKIIKLQDLIQRQAAPWDLIQFGPRIDGDTLPVHPLKALQDGAGKDIELIIGCTKDESRLFTALLPQLRKMEADAVQKMVLGFLKTINKDETINQQIYETYRESTKELGSTLPLDILNAIFTDYMFRVPATRYAEAQKAHQPNTYNYLFTWPSPAIKGMLGSCHAIELAFIFGTLNVPKMDMFFGKGPDAEKLSENMMDTWLAFAHSGNPNNESIPEWPSYNTEKRATMFMDKEFKIVEAPFDKERAVWDEFQKI
jgi:para-nitrobenzyl esterase